MVSNLMPGMAPPEPPTRWEETSMKEDFEKIREAFLKWKSDYEVEIDINTSPMIHVTEVTLEELSEIMTGEL